MLFPKLLPAAFFDEAHNAGGGRHNNSIYSPLVVMWLLITQRLCGGASLEVAVLELLRGLPANFWPRPCKRLRRWWEGGKAPSSHTGAYNQARQALPLWAKAQETLAAEFGAERTAALVHELNALVGAEA